MSEKNRKLLFVAVFALAFYVFGAACVESFVNYYTWGFIGAEEFRAYHNALSSRIIVVMVFPWLAEICMTFVLMRLRPSAIPLSAIVSAQALNFVALVSTVFIQLPIQTQFGESGLSLEALDRLLTTDPIRWVSAILKMALYISMMSWVVNAGESRERLGCEERVAMSYSE
jgi:hypothetical protein